VYQNRVFQYTFEVRSFAPHVGPAAHSAMHSCRLPPRSKCFQNVIGIQIGHARNFVDGRLEKATFQNFIHRLKRGIDGGKPSSLCKVQDDMFADLHSRALQCTLREFVYPFPPFVYCGVSNPGGFDQLRHINWPGWALVL
jgi:hypothetical protein